MQTLVFLHAHPDDEASNSSGTITLAVERGYRVVVVFATNGDHGTVPPDLAEGETVVQRRRTEAEAAARVLGIARLAWLGYEDSGMTGWQQNSNPACFARADVDEAAAKLAAILDEEDADVLIGYDWHGNYGHPDHIKVNPVTYRAAELAARRPRVLELTGNSDAAERLAAQARALGFDLAPDEMIGDDGLPIGVPESQIHWQVDVTGVIDRKRAALAAHGSQADTQQMLALPEAAFTAWFGYEYYREEGRDTDMVLDWPL